MIADQIEAGMLNFHHLGREIFGQKGVVAGITHKRTGTTIVTMSRGNEIHYKHDEPVDVVR